MQYTPPSAAAGGVWKTYGVDSQNANPFTNVTIGNGLLVARWWQEKEVVVDFSTPPFLTFIQVVFKLGSTSSIDSTIIFQGPFGQQGQNVEIDAYLEDADDDNPDSFFPMVPTQVFALDQSSSQGWPGVAISPSDASCFIAAGASPDNPGNVWGTSVPFTWAEGDMLMVQRLYMASFYGD